MNNGEQTVVISFGPGAESAEAFERLCDEVEVVLEKKLWVRWNAMRFPKTFPAASLSCVAPMRR